jgi:segregation and condensation protein A
VPEQPEQPEILEAGQATYSVALPAGGFEGPLDLLLHLCQKHELNILDIPIAFVTEKYLEYLAVMQLTWSADPQAGPGLNVASEYLLMAATLAHIKSKTLLPAPPPGQEDDAQLEEEEDPREALILRLLQYQKYKQAAADLAARGITGADTFTRGVAIEEAIQTGMAPLAEIPLYALVEAFQTVLARNKVKISHDVLTDRISLADRIGELADVLQAKKRVTFDELFASIEVTTRFDLVITFLALLEMTKLRMTRLIQTDPLSPLYVEISGDPDATPLDKTVFGGTP